MRSDRIKWNRIEAGVYEGLYSNEVRFTIKKIKRTWVLQDPVAVIGGFVPEWQYVTLTGAQYHAEGIVAREEKAADRMYQEQFKAKIGEELYRWIKGLEERVEYLEDEIRGLQR